ncbi:hypothetical protein BKI52_10020 [marine bacterium AO1-C]|nr:hypothetical protein BKI52_10020 [marine bacterium AO1-C]
MKLSDLLNSTTTKRDALKPAFTAGQVPTQQHFHDMIDGLFQIQGTTLYKDDNNGLGIQAGTDPTKPVLHFYDDPTQEPLWTVGVQNGLEIKDSTSVTRLAVANDGKVGIGTTAPTSFFEVFTTPGNSATGLVISQGPDGGNTNSGRLFFHNASDPGNSFTMMKTLNRLSFMSNATPGTGSGTERISLTNQGNVGIGINVPQSKLEILQSQPYTNAHEASALVVRTPTAPSPNDGRMVGISLTIGESADIHNLNQKSASIFAQSTNQYANIVDMLFYTRGSSSPYYSEKMRITGNGNVGIGTTNPLGKVDILLGGFANASALSFQEVDSNPTIKLYRPTGSFVSDVATVYPWWIENSHTGLGFRSGSHAIRGTETVSTKIFFKHNGDVGIGTTDPTEKLAIKGKLQLNSETTSGAVKMYFQMSDTNETKYNNVWPDQHERAVMFKSSAYLDVHSAGGIGYQFWTYGVTGSNSNGVVGGEIQAMVIRKDGKVGIGKATPAAKLDVGGSIAVNGSVVHSSDIRFKRNIQPIASNIIAKLNQLKASTYQWRTNEHKEQGFEEGTYIGFIAQEMKALYPELVSEDSEGYLSINYTGLIPIIVEANKQQQQRIEALEVQLAELMKK